MLVIAQIYGTARIAYGQGRAMQRDFVELVSEPSTRACATDSLQSFAKGSGDRLGFCLPVSLASALASSSPFRVSDVQLK